MRDLKAGFTLVELVAVIVILGALAVVALPRFINLQDEAQAAALDGVKGAAAAAHGSNLAAAYASSPDAQTMEDCANTADLMQGDLAGYDFEGDGAEDGDPLGTELDCAVAQRSTGNVATFTGYVVPN